MAKILAIDQSTSGTKAILFDERGRVVHRCTEGHRQVYPQSDWVEHDPEEIFEKTLLAVRHVIEQSGTDTADIASLAITNQRETVVAWERKTGKPVYNAVVWQCQRGAGVCRSLKEQGCDELVESKTGLLIDPYFSATGLKWIVDNVAGVRRKAEAGELAFGTIDSWLIWKLTGGKVHATDYSNACRTMLFNIHELKWDKELLDLMGIHESMAPEVRFSDAVFGYTKIDGILKKEIPISGVMGDSHAACFGQNCFRKGQAKATYGTGSSIMMHIGKKPIRSPKGLVTSIAWGCKGEVDYVFEGNIHCTGDTVKWLVHDLELIGDSKMSEAIATSVDGNNGVYFVPAFVGLGAPYWDNQARACITGMRRSTKKAHVVRAALEAIAYQIKDLVDLMSSGAGAKLQELRVDGGPTRNDFLMQFQADMLDCTVERTRVEEVSAMGSALMAGMTCGLWKSLEQIQSLRIIDKSFKPKMDSITREKHFQGWKEAVKRVLTVS